jgi:hypothetical protein
MFYLNISSTKPNKIPKTNQPRPPNAIKVRINSFQSSPLITYYLLVLLHHAINPEINNAGIPIIGQAQTKNIKKITAQKFIVNDL